MLHTLKKHNTKPPLYQKSAAKFWDDPYISKNMLKAHLNPDLESATRKMDFVRRSADWIADTLPPDNYKRLLDLGCGPGIYAELFYEKGYQVTGLDLSPNSIQYSRKSATDKGMDIEYTKANYVDAAIEYEYDLITMIYCDFGVLSDTERKQLLKKVYNALSPSGCFLFDVFTPFSYKDCEEFKRWSYEEGGFWYPDAYLLLESLYRYNDDNTFLSQYIVVTDEETTCYHNWEHTFSVEELECDLKEAGFKDIQIYGNAAGDKYESGSETICVVGGK